MRYVFVDTFYWIARINPRDHWHKKARELDSSLKDVTLITSEAVLIELLNYFSGYGPGMRQAASRIVRGVIEDSPIILVGGGDSTAPFLSVPTFFEDGLALFESRLDKGYSMTDCISMGIMRGFGATEVLTRDHHFAQEGFVVLL